MQHMDWAKLPPLRMHIQVSFGNRLFTDSQTFLESIDGSQPYIRRTPYRVAKQGSAQ